MEIKKANLKFKGALTKRPSTSEIVLHHTAVSVKQSVEVIHNYYLNRKDDNFLGIGYNFYVRKDGTVWQGRPVWAQGGHCFYHNHKSVGICFEGNFDKETMGDKQYKAGVELIKYVLSLYPNCVIYKHKQLNNTACPGKNFPFDKMVKASKEKAVTTTQKQTSAPAPATSFKVGDKVKVTANYAASAYDKSAPYSASKGAVRYILKIYKGANYPYRIGVKKGVLSNSNTSGFASAKGLKKI